MTEDQIFERRLLDEQRHADTERKIDDLTTEIAALKTSVAELVEAWNTAGNLVRFIKWLAGMATAGLVILAAWKSSGIRL